MSKSAEKTVELKLPTFIQDEAGAYINIVDATWDDLAFEKAALEQSLDVQRLKAISAAMRQLKIPMKGTSLRVRNVVRGPISYAAFAPLDELLAG